VAIDDVLPLNAARCDATVNLKCFGARGQQRTKFDVFIYICGGVPHYSARISTIYLLPLAKFGWVPFADLRV